MANNFSKIEKNIVKNKTARLEMLVQAENDKEFQDILYTKCLS